MSDGSENNRGGARPGAGRKPRTVEDDLHRRLLKALKRGGTNRLDDIFAGLVDDCFATSFRIRHASRAMLFERLYGKTAPPRADDGEGDQNDGTFIVRVPVRMSAEEWQKSVTPSEPPSSQ